VRVASSKPDCEKILLIQRDPRLVEMLIDAFVRRFNTNITCVAGAEDALDIDMVEHHHIVVADTSLAQMDANRLTRRLMELRRRPVILMSSAAAASDVIDALRSGAADYFVKPFELRLLLDSMDHQMRRYRAERHLMRRHEHLRQGYRSLIQQRRQLNQRVELLCKDLVAAHKRLTLRVLERETGARLTA